MRGLNLLANAFLFQAAEERPHDCSAPTVTMPAHVELPVVLVAEGLEVVADELVALVGGHHALPFRACAAIHPSAEHQVRARRFRATQTTAPRPASISA